jgi:rubredoxin-NAD+ reductase
MHPIIIIGTGFAGYELATQFRKLDSTTSLILITQDNGDFYSKPMLSKALTDKKTADALATKNVETMAQHLNAKILTHTCVTKIDVENKKLYCDEQVLVYSKLVFACGAHVKQPPFEQTLHVNDLEDYRQFRQSIESKKHITIIGAGLIGCEFANDLTNVGYKVEIISTDHSLMAQLIPPRISDLLKGVLEKQGATFHLNTSIKTIEKCDDQFTVVLNTEKAFTTDLVFSAIGLSPNIDLAKLAGIKTNTGIITNQYLQTNIPDIFALGDCAEVEKFNLKYIGPIRQCAPALAKTLTGELTPVAYPGMRINIKTTSYKISVCPPILDPAGEWKVEIDPDNSAKALHYDSSGKLNGFIVTHNRYQEHFALEKEMPVWL